MKIKNKVCCLFLMMMVLVVAGCGSASKESDTLSNNITISGSVRVPSSINESLSSSTSLSSSVSSMSLSVGVSQTSSTSDLELLVQPGIVTLYRVTTDGSTSNYEKTAFETTVTNGKFSLTNTIPEGVYVAVVESGAKRVMEYGFVVENDNDISFEMTPIKSYCSALIEDVLDDFSAISVVLTDKIFQDRCEDLKNSMGAFRVQKVTTGLSLKPQMYTGPSEVDKQEVEKYIKFATFSSSIGSGTDYDSSRKQIKVTYTASNSNFKPSSIGFLLRPSDDFSVFHYWIPIINRSSYIQTEFQTGNDPHEKYVKLTFKNSSGDTICQSSSQDGLEESVNAEDINIFGSILRYVDSSSGASSGSHEMGILPFSKGYLYNDRPIEVSACSPDDVTTIEISYIRPGNGADAVVDPVSLIPQNIDTQGGFCVSVKNTSDVNYEKGPGTPVASIAVLYDEEGFPVDFFALTSSDYTTSLGADETVDLCNFQWNTPYVGPLVSSIEVHVK